MILKVKVLPEFKGSDLVPRRSSTNAAGYDLVAAEPTTVYVGMRTRVRCGIQVEIPEGYYGAVHPRSGLAWKYGVTVLNAPGTIDSDYRGEVLVTLVNHGKIPYEIKAGDRVAQLLIIKHETPLVEIVDNLSDTTRGEAGFGSTGK